MLYGRELTAVEGEQPITLLMEAGHLVTRETTRSFVVYRTAARAVPQTVPGVSNRRADGSQTGISTQD